MLHGLESSYKLQWPFEEENLPKPRSLCTPYFLSPKGDVSDSAFFSFEGVQHYSPVHICSRYFKKGGEIEKMRAKQMEG